MDNKCLKKSTMQQLKTLVLHMEENPELARGVPVFGRNKFLGEEEWQKLCTKLNSLGPPTRAIGEWKKSWADLKSRTKKKIADNNKSFRETGGGLYRYSSLTELEEIIDRTLLMSSAAAPRGAVFGCGESEPPCETQSFEDCFIALVESPARCSKSVAVVTPNRIQKAIETQQPPQNTKEAPTNQQQNVSANNLQKRRINDSDHELPACPPSSKKKKVVDEQISLIRRQLRVAEQNAATSADQANALKRLADAAEMQAEAAKRSADAAEVTSASIKELLKTTMKIEKTIETLVVKN